MRKKDNKQLLTVIFSLIAIILLHNHISSQSIIELPGLVSYFPMGTPIEELSGQTITINGPLVTDGKIGKAYLFDGLDDNILFSPSYNINKELSIEAWVYPTKAQQGYIVSKINSYLLQMQANTTTNKANFQGGIYWLNGTKYTWAGMVGTPTITLNNWHHIVFTYSDINGARIYLNGELKTTQTSTKTISSSNNKISIGNREDYETFGNRAFKGIIDEVRIYDKELTTTEVSSLFKTSGTTTPDLSTCGNNFCEVTKGETIINCPQDCNNNLCGNTICDPGENKDNCPLDCYTSSYNKREIWAVYQSSEQVYNKLKTLAIKHPSKMSYEVIGESIQGKELLLFKAGNLDLCKKESSKGKFMFDGRIHGPEDCGTENGIEFIKWALEDESLYARSVREKNCLLFIPIINIDSVRRQNMRTNYELSEGGPLAVSYGVDLNRNFPTGWGQSGSGEPTDNYQYRGISAGSEPETKAVVYAMKKYEPNVYMNVHCGMEMLRYKELTPTTQKILGLITKISSETGAITNLKYNPGKGCSGGLACSEGSTWSGGNGWIHETSTWEHLPEKLDDYLKVWYPQTFPIYLAMAQAVEADIIIPPSSDDDYGGGTKPTIPSVEEIIIPVSDIKEFINDNTPLLIVVAVMILLMIMARNNNRRRRW